MNVERLQKAVCCRHRCSPYIKTIRAALIREVLASAAMMCPESRYHSPVPICRSLGKFLRPFDLIDSKELYRAEIYQTKDGNYLFFGSASILCDGESLSILLFDTVPMQEKPGNGKLHWL